MSDSSTKLPSNSEESLERLRSLANASSVEMPKDLSKYQLAGYLLQSGKVISESMGNNGENILKNLEKRSSIEVDSETVPKEIWSGAQRNSVILISPGQTFSQNINRNIHSQFILKLISDPKIQPEIKLFESGKEIPLSIIQFSSLLKISLVKPKALESKTIKLVVKNTSDLTISFAGHNTEFQIRYFDFQDVSSQRTFQRKLSRALSLVKNGEFKALIKAVYYFSKGKMMRLRRTLTLSSVMLTVFLASCVLPPNDIGPRVYSDQEIRYINDTQKGIDYSNSGRFLKAELYLRNALAATNDPPPLLLSNLGFTLRAQGKFDEAVRNFNQALKKEPYFLHARVNLGRTYFEMGDLESALREYKRAESDYYGYWLGAPDERLSSNFGNDDLLYVYSNIAIMLAQKGELWEAICYSQYALDLHSPNYKQQSHARFLISLEQYFLAGEVLRQAIYVGQQVSAPLPASLIAAMGTPAPTFAPEEDPSLIFDLGVVKLLEENFPLAGEAFDRVLTLTIVPADIRQLTQILRFEVAKVQNDTETIELLNRSFDEISEELCESDSYVTPAFWPVALKKRVLESRNGICASRSGWMLG